MPVAALSPILFAIHGVGMSLALAVLRRGGERQAAPGQQRGPMLPCLVSPSHPTDLDECQMLNQCQHKCRNSLGTYRCVCPPGYRLLPNGKSCHGQCWGMSLTWWDACVPWGWPGSPQCPGCHLCSKKSSFSTFRGELFQAQHPVKSGCFCLAAPVSKTPGRERRRWRSWGLNPCLSLVHMHTSASSDPSFLCLQMWTNVQKARSSVARARCASTPAEVPSVWMPHALTGTREAPVPGESCHGAGGACPLPHLTGPDPLAAPALLPHPMSSRLLCRLCVGVCTPDCGSAGPPMLRYQLLTLPLGITAGRDVVHLAPGTALRHHPIFSLLEQEPGSPFALRTEQGRGIISTLRPLRDPGTHRLKVQALAPGRQRAPSIFLLFISVSPYPY